jgi:hypothetical protein
VRFWFLVGAAAVFFLARSLVRYIGEWREEAVMIGEPSPTLREGVRDWAHWLVGRDPDPDPVPDPSPNIMPEYEMVPCACPPEERNALCDQGRHRAPRMVTFGQGYRMPALAGPDVPKVSPLDAWVAASIDNGARSATIIREGIGTFGVSEKTVKRAISRVKQQRAEVGQRS